MARRKQTARKRAPAAPASDRISAKITPDRAPDDPTLDDQIFTTTLSLHQLFEQQARQMLDRTDLDEEQKQNVLVAMSCPCCGAGAMSFTAKLRR